MGNDDFFLDDLNNQKPKKKKVNSGRKGRAGERFLVDTLNERFTNILESNPDWGKFSRSVGSGNRSKQKVVLSKQVESAFASDLVSPPTFIYTVENKFGYNQVDLCAAFTKGHKVIDSFLDQVSKDAKRVQKKPLLAWKKDYKPCLAFILDENKLFEKTIYKMFYREWTVISLSKLLELPDCHFFT